VLFGRVSATAATKLEPMDTVDWPDSVQRVRRRLAHLGYEGEVTMLAESARSAQQAADAVGAEVGAIAKAIIFRRSGDDVPVLVITSGANRVDIAKVEELVGEVGKADAAYVRERTGFAIGGVSPIGMDPDAVVLFDEDLTRFDTVWAAAGHPNSVFEATPAQLAAYAGARVEDIRVDDGESDD